MLGRPGACSRPTRPKERSARSKPTARSPWVSNADVLHRRRHAARVAAPYPAGRFSFGRCAAGSRARRVTIGRQRPLGYTRRRRCTLAPKSNPNLRSLRRGCLGLRSRGRACGLRASERERRVEARLVPPRRQRARSLGVEVPARPLELRRQQHRVSMVEVFAVVLHVVRAVDDTEARS